MNKYDHASIEAVAQQYWEEHHTFHCEEDLTKEKFYCLSMFPYPSGDLHMGHVRNYTIGDVIARYQRSLGKHVLHPIGWDAFGLPAENAAIANHLPPAEWTEKNIKKMRKQFKQLGYSFDWHREITTCDPSYYRWEQWLFIQLYKKGLVYKKKSLVNWDPVDQTVLANEQVIDGKGWRSGAPVERLEIPQWFFKITHYAGQLLDDLELLTDWPVSVRTMQRNWIGKSEGITIQFPLHRHKQKLTIFTTRADTLMGVTYLAISPEHPLALKAAQKDPNIAQFLEKCRHTKVAEAEIATQIKAGVCLKTEALHPLTGEKLPIWVTNFVLMDYGSGAIMAVPAHDPRDFEFARQYGLAIKPVIQPLNNTAWDFHQGAYTGEGILINSDPFNGLPNEIARKKIQNFLIKRQQGEEQINYRLRDWGISRQRYWGTPIPMIQCKRCGDIPVPEESLPVILPPDLIPDGHASPLKSSRKFYRTTCPQCGEPARRETDTMDTFVESSWYYARYGSYDQQKAMLDDRAKYWTPVDQYVGGIEHAVLHLLYARFMHKVLRDEGLLNSPEPFKSLLTQGMVLKEGYKMSKSKGNIVAPQHLIKKYGADTVRLFIIFASPPEQDLEWSDSGVEGAYRFLKKLWHFATQIKTSFNGAYDASDSKFQSQYQQIHLILQQAQQDMAKLQLNTVVSAAMKLFNIINKMDLHDQNQQPIIYEGMSILLRLLSPITPHITHQLWQNLGFGEDISQANWPKVNEKALQMDQIHLVIQINGKLRGKITVPSHANNKVIEQIALQEESIQRYLNNQEIKKIIIVPNKLINIVI